MENNIKVYTLENNFLKIEILNLGACIKKIELKDKNNIPRNIVLGYDNLEEYIENPAYLGAIIGRTAGRIKNGILNIDGKEYNLSINNSTNTLHGGKNSISHRFWNIEKLNNKIICTIKSPNLENGYPGNIEIKIEYILFENELEIKYYANTDRKTYLNLTNHSYFNLSGDYTNTIYEDILLINSDYFLGINENSIPTNLISLDNSIFNFRVPKKIKDFFSGDDEQKDLANNGIDHPYILNNKNAVIIKNENTGIKISVETDNPAVVIYTANYLNEIGFKKHSAICFETQEAPNLFQDKKLNINPTFIDENNSYQKYTKFIFKIEK
ncbi:aldose epimerase family protein [Fusobacterium massiliense]|jgi:aldose 1-epimerase|uniref:aldose epimerase family protein n=1 Tax=Fusobacterium massiliense TaxID=1852365 RepID=UPI0028D12D85|nr:aldose epimerase family protein [Fusobacterium massiliense]